MDPLRFDELRRANVARCERHYQPVRDASLSEWHARAAGELAELAEAIRSAERSGDEPSIAALADVADEAADVVIYLDLVCARAGIDLGAAIRAKFDRVSRERLGSEIVLGSIER